MKKFLVLLFLMIIGTSVYAQKSYITVNAHPYSTSSYYIYITGDVPSGIDKINYYGHHCETSYYSVGEVLNILASYGYEVEMMVGGITMGSAPRVQYLLSKNSSSNQTQIEGDVNNDSEVNIADVNKVISLILDKIRENPNLLEELGIEQPK